MKLLKARLIYLLLPALLFVTGKSYAGGFPVRPGSWMVSSSVNYFFANKGWDSLRVLSPFAENGKYTSVSYSIYTEVGLTRRFTFVGTLPYVTSNYTQNGLQQLSSGLTDLEVGLRYYLANINYIYYFSIQGTAIVPLYKNPNLGYMENGAELRLSFAGSGHIFSRNYYFTVENGIRQYFGTNGPVQDRYAGTFGLSLDKKLKHQFSATISGFYSTSSFTKFNPNLATNKNFAFNQASVSYGYAFTKRVSLIVSAGTFINGRNTGDGSTLSASLILKPF